MTMSSQVSSHHYKGLPHNDYFDNYPQVPILEFIKETKDHEVFMTIYNFQGISLDNVDTPNMVRFYIYLYDLKEDKVYSRQAKFKIYSHDKLLHKTDFMSPEQENIYITHLQINEQDNLRMEVVMLDVNGEEKIVSMEFQITKSVWEKYGVFIAIVAFFVLIGIIKKFISKKEGGDVQLA